MRQRVATFVSQVCVAASGRHTSQQLQALSEAEAAIPTFSPQSVGRIAVHRLGSIAWHGCLDDMSAQRNLISSVLALKALLRDSRCDIPCVTASLLEKRRMPHRMRWTVIYMMGFLQDG
jgi:hypothetical protein